MKMSKKALFSLLAVSGLGLTAVVPTASAFAATGSSSIDAAGDVAWGTAANGRLSSSSNGGTLDFVIANKAATGNDATVGTATATSEGSTQVISDVLTLDAVPDLAFGTTVAGSTKQLQNNKSHQVNDGNNQGLVSVTDSRKTSVTAGTPPTTTETKGLGYALNVKASQFKAYTDNTFSNVDATNVGVDGWKLNITPSGDVLGSDGNARNGVSKNDISLAPTAAAESAEATLMSAEASAEGLSTSYGQAKLLLSKGEDASLVVPDKATKGFYATTITWTLNADASAKIN